MGVASKQLMTLLTSPFPLPFTLSPRPSTFHLLRLSSTFSTYTIFPSNHRSPISPSPNYFHSHTVNATTRDDFYTDSSPISKTVQSPYPWPEWSNFIESLRLNGYFNSQISQQFNGEDSLAVDDGLPGDFVVAVNACVEFARRNPNILGLLSRNDIEIVVGNVHPFLFPSGVDSARRMNSFLAANQNIDLMHERAYLVDLMRFLLSYVYDPVGSDRTNHNNGQIVETSVRNILRQLDYESRVANAPKLSSPMPEQFPGRYGQTSAPLRQNIEMKRGDWICSKCTFMNFARNMNCLECNETRPKRQLAGGEWNCPQCDFFNYGKNTVCIRCDCRRPGEVSGAADRRFGSEYNNDILNNNLTTRAPPLGQRMANAGTYEANNIQPVDGMGTGKNSGVPVGRHLDRILGRTSEGSKSEYVPFKPLPSDMFNKPQKSMVEDQATRSSHIPPSTANAPTSSGNSSDSLPLSRKPINHIESKEDKEQAEKSERWFKKVAELHDVTDLASAISDEDFPEIMPMRKGENRFVVSKKKDRSLTSPLHKRRIAMEQSTSTTNFVPFVPFPPDYFANKNKVPETEESTAKDTNPTSSFATPEVQIAEKTTGTLDSGTSRNSAQSSEIQQSKKASWDTSFSGKNVSENRSDYSYGNPSGNSTVAPNDRQYDSRENGSGASWENSRSSSLSPSGNSSRQSENANSTKESWKGGFSGKSLEGSLVKEPDPLDMSEEAKAQRWFRRVAQIKDISELSQIPDEDFPSIMPMRKGVNRFVVSKRKTPLERRLTSPQYRRNLPIVSSEPVKEDKTES
ncbi:hypothetical protein ACHQM5_019988 [Ranunculus cassubicifolius]